MGRLEYVRVLDEISQQGWAKSVMLVCGFLGKDIRVVNWVGGVSFKMVKKTLVRRLVNGVSVFGNLCYMKISPSMDLIGVLEFIIRREDMYILFVMDEGEGFSGDIVFRLRNKGFLGVINFIKMLYSYRLNMLKFGVFTPICLLKVLHYKK